MTSSTRSGPRSRESEKKIHLLIVSNRKGIIVACGQRTGISTMRATNNRDLVTCKICRSSPLMVEGI